MSTKILVTGGTGFIGSALVRALVEKGYAVRVLDNDSRGAIHRLKDICNEIDWLSGDIREFADVERAMRGVKTVIHLAYVNGTEYFYSKPDLVLEVGVKGMLNVLDACRQHAVPELFLASSSEVYQQPPTIPTDETAPLVVPDPRNPRYSYGGGKIISELLALHSAVDFDRVVIFRPHNVYGPDMGWQHVIPQMAVRLHEAIRSTSARNVKIDFPIQGTGAETRSFVYIEDFVQGVFCLLDNACDRNIYHIGTEDEISITQLAEQIAQYFGREINVVAGPLQKGSVQRRCPDISKIVELGYKPAVALADGIRNTLDWYVSRLEKKLSA